MRQVEPTARQTFVVCITVDCVTARQPDANLRMNHAWVYVNRTRAKYTPYTWYVYVLHSRGGSHTFAALRRFFQRLSHTQAHVVPVRRTWLFRNIISLNEYNFRPWAFQNFTIAWHTSDWLDYLQL